MMLDIDSENFLHWLVVNVNGTDVSSGDVIAEYESPTPEVNKPHRYLFTAYEQLSGEIQPAYLASFVAKNCQRAGARRGLSDPKSFAAFYNLAQPPVAANYFSVRYNDFVKSIRDYCADKN